MKEGNKVSIPGFPKTAQTNHSNSLFIHIAYLALHNMLLQKGILLLQTSHCLAP